MQLRPSYEGRTTVNIVRCGCHDGEDGGATLAVSLKLDARRGAGFSYLEGVSPSDLALRL